jgi:hypothetical protein
MAVRKFTALHGAPKRFQSDQGTQLVAASKQIATWDWTAVHEGVERAGAEFHVVPTGGGEADWPVEETPGEHHGQPLVNTGRAQQADSEEHGEPGDQLSEYAATPAAGQGLCGGNEDEV